MLSFNTWYHIAVVRNGDNEKLFVDGVIVGERAYNHTYKVHRIRIGEGALEQTVVVVNGTTNPLSGYIQDFPFPKKQFTQDVSHLLLFLQMNLLNQMNQLVMK